MKMPNKTVYLILVILGFILGIIWGALSLSPYNKMKVAINNGDVITAKANAKKITMFVLIGVAVNVLVFFGRIAV